MSLQRNGHREIQIQMGRGGLAWGLLDRVLNATLEMERIKYPGLYQYYHSKRIKWN